MWGVIDIQGSSVFTHVTAVTTILLLISSTTVGNHFDSGEYYLGYFSAPSESSVSVMLITSEPEQVPYYIEAPGVTYYCNGTFTADNEDIIDLPDSVIVSEYENSQHYGIHVNIQNNRVTVIGQTVSKFSRDTFLALPVINVSNDSEFIYYGISVRRNQAAYKSRILIVGITNNTSVKFTVTQERVTINGSSLFPGMEYSSVINKLQTFLIESDKDLTGTKIITNNQVSVFSGHEAGNAIPDPDHTDHLIEQIPSINFWGLTYYVVPFATGSYSIKVLTAYNSTKVTVYCNHTKQTSFTINEGKSELISDYEQKYCAIHSNKKILVAQFSHGRELGNMNNASEPMMTLVPATVHYLNKLDFSTIKSSKNYSHFVNIIVMARYFQPGMIYMRTAKANRSLQSYGLEWVPIVVDNITKVYAARVVIPEGVVQIVHANTSALMTAIVYGFGERNSYGNPAGLKLIDPCSTFPCGNSGVCLPDGYGYKCKCNDGKTVRTSCPVPTSSTLVVPSTTIVPVPSISITGSSVITISTTSTQKSTFTSTPPIPSPTAVCSKEIDTTNGIEWPSVNVTESTNVTTNCSEGTAIRLCNLNGDWGMPILTNCSTSTCGYSFLTHIMKQMQMTEDVAVLMEFILSLTDVSRRACTNIASSDELRNANLLFQFILSIIEQYPELLSSKDIVQNILDSFSDALHPNNTAGWKELEKVNPGQNQMLLNSTERFGLLLAENLDEGSTKAVKSDNIIIEATLVDNNAAEDVIFPGTNSSISDLVSITIPAEFIQCRSEATGVNSVPIVSIYYSNMEEIISYGRNNSVQPVSEVLSSQVTKTSATCASKDSAIQLMFRYNLSLYSGINTSTPRCGYWNYLLNKGRGDWDTEGVTVIRNSREDSTIICNSTHLTSFAVLVDVSGGHQDFSANERKALSIVSYIGCGVSIVCLLITIIALVYYRNTLLRGVHNFIHLNLAIALLMGLLVFVGGIERATEHEIACKLVAALLHYFFTAVFTWMMCEGIMLYFMLVKVFNIGLGERKAFYLALGWGIPIPIVATGAGIAHDQYGRDEFCWIDTENGSIWAFVAPMLAIISVNIIFLILSIRSLIISTRNKRAASGSSNTKLVKNVIKATIILLPLLGITWAFGLLAVNQGSSVFAWIFTILNSLQGMFIFIFHVVRNEKVWKKITTFWKSKEKQNGSSLSRQQSATSFTIRSTDSFRNKTRRIAQVASTDHNPSNTLVKLKSRFETQMSIIDGDFPTDIDKKLINKANTPDTETKIEEELSSTSPQHSRDPSNLETEL